MNFEVHLLGIWLVIMIIHGLLVNNLGESFVHVPMYIGLFAAVIIVIRRKWSLLSLGISMLLFLLLIFMLLSGLTGLDPGNSINTIKLYLKGLLLAVMIGGVIKDENQIKMISLYCLSGIIFGAYEAYRQYFTGDFAINSVYVQRVAGLSGDPNDTAMLLLAGVPLCVYWLTHSKTLYLKLFYIFCLVSIIGAIVLTGSRGGSVSLFFIMGLMFVKKPSFNGALIGALIIILGLFAAPSSYWERMETLYKGETHGRSLDKRSNFVIKGLKVFSDNPLLGVGAGNFGKSIDKMNTEVLIRSQFGKEHVAHNMYLQFFVENGVITGVIFLMVLSYPLISLLTFDKYNKDELSAYGLGFCMATSLFAMLFAGLFLSQAKNSVLWFYVGIGIASISMIKTNRLKIT